VGDKEGGEVGMEGEGRGGRGGEDGKGGECPWDPENKTLSKGTV